MSSRILHSRLGLNLEAFRVLFDRVVSYGLGARETGLLLAAACLDPANSGRYARTVTSTFCNIFCADAIWLALQYAAAFQKAGPNPSCDEFLDAVAAVIVDGAFIEAPPIFEAVHSSSVRNFRAPEGPSFEHGPLPEFMMFDAERNTGSLGRANDMVDKALQSGEAVDVSGKGFPDESGILLYARPRPNSGHVAIIHHLEGLPPLYSQAGSTNYTLAEVPSYVKRWIVDGQPLRGSSGPMLFLPFSDGAFSQLSNTAIMSRRAPDFDRVLAYGPALRATVRAFDAGSNFLTFEREEELPDPWDAHLVAENSQAPEIENETDVPRADRDVSPEAAPVLLAIQELTPVTTSDALQNQIAKDDFAARAVAHYSGKLPTSTPSWQPDYIYEPE